MCVLGHCLHTQPSSWQLCLSLDFLLVHHLKVSERWDLRAVSGLFWACTPLHTRLWLLYFQKYVGAFKAPIHITFLRFSPEYFCLVYHLPQVFPTTSGMCEFKELPVVVSNKCPWGKGFLHWASSTSDQIKTAWQMESSKEWPER